MRGGVRQRPGGLGQGPRGVLARQPLVEGLGPATVGPGLEGHELLRPEIRYLRVRDGQGLEHVEGGGHVHIRAVQGLIELNAVDLAEVAQAALTPAVTVHGPVQDQGIGDGTRLAIQALADRGQAVAGELGLQDRPRGH